MQIGAAAAAWSAAPGRGESMSDARTEPPERFRVSPSECHRLLMDRTEQELRYRGSEIGAWQRTLRARLRQLLGPEPEARVPLAPRTLWKRETELGTIEKIVFACEAGADTPAYFCLPRNGAGPFPVAICVQGHSTGMHNSIAVAFEDETQPIDVPGDRDFALGALKRGFAALCLEQRSFGERAERAQKSVAKNSKCHDAAAHAMMLGRTLIGERVWDVDRAIDYLETRPEIDRSRLGVMGNSGGGTTSLFAAAMLERLRFAMPSCYFCSFRASIMSLYHCICNYVPGLFQVAEMADVLGLFAPRPVVVVAGLEDNIFPIEAARSEFERLKEIYAAAGAADKCRLVVGPEGHRFYADLAWPQLIGLLA